jgi:hypothetical protein
MKVSNADRQNISEALLTAIIHRLALSADGWVKSHAKFILVTAVAATPLRRVSDFRADYQRLLRAVGVCNERPFC